MVLSSGVQLAQFFLLKLFSYDAEPTQAPQNLTLLELKDATTALLAWEPVANDSIRGHFKGYKVSWF